MKRQRRWISACARIVTAVLALAMLALVWPASGVTAHASLRGSDPPDGARLKRAPDRVIAWFDQELDAERSTLQVFDAAGRRVEAGGGVDLDDPDHAAMIARFLRPLPDGVYTVRWRAVSVEDGDTTSGAFTFVIGEPIVEAGRGAGPAPREGAISLVAGLGALVVAGLLFRRAR